MATPIFIAWQALPVKGRGGGSFLEVETDGRAAYAAPWRGLRCEHHGGGRTEWTPFLVAAERSQGQIRQKTLYRLPAIRSCCVADDYRRAAWWHDVEWAIKLWGELGDGPQAEASAAARSTILAELREVVPKPSAAGLRAFATFRARREAEDLARDIANRIYWDERVRRHQTQPQEAIAHATEPGVGFAVLNLKPTATLDQIKARHRVLAKEHHPDRGGDPARFRTIQAAYEAVLADYHRRPRE